MRTIAPADHLADTAPHRLDALTWPLWGMHARLVCDGSTLTTAKAVADARLHEVELAISRFRDDSELASLNRAAQNRPVEVTVSATLADILAACLEAARRTGGAVDPCVGADLVRWGYDRDLDAVRADSAGLPQRGTGRRRAATSWAQIQLRGRDLRLPAGTTLDVGAVGKAWAVDDVAARIACEIGGVALVSIGGDLSAAGPAPATGWIVDVGDGVGDNHGGQPHATIRVAGGGIATSSTLRRTWATPSGPVCHIVHPGTGDPVQPRWRTVTVHAETAAQANAAATATLVHGAMGLLWLRETGLAARVVGRSGRVHHLNGWPVEGEQP